MPSEKELAAEMLEFLNKFDPLEDDGPLLPAEAEFLKQTKSEATAKDARYFRHKGRLCMLWPVEDGSIQMKFADGNPPPKNL
jgi:hypothetical protein